MYASLSFENRIQEKMHQLGITGDFLCALAKVHPSRLSHAIRGIKAITNADGEKLMDYLGQLEALAAEVAPIPVSFRNPNVIRELLLARADAAAAGGAK
jgi:hypothetical protein